MIRLLPVSIIAFFAASCSKDGSSKPYLVGKWLQTEYYNDSRIGGCNCWKSVDEIAANKLEFKKDGTYQMTPPMYSSVYYCIGDYTVVNDSTLTLKMSCTTPPTTETHWFSKEGNYLTIRYQGPSFDFKFKYKKVTRF